MESKMMVPY